VRPEEESMNPEEVIARKVVQMYLEGRSVKEIAEELGISMSTIYRLLAKKGVELRRRKYRARGRLTPEELEKIRKMYVEGKTIYAIAKELDRPTSTIYYALKRMGLLGKREESGSGS
jgi:excisionase family DNA binding protein